MDSFLKWTEMTKARFMELWSGMQDGSLVAAWPEGKEPATRAERVEARQIRALAMLAAEGEDLADLAALEWHKLEVWKDDEIVNVKVLRRRKLSR